MKNKELEELKPVYIHEVCYPPADEINLLDLALVLVRRKALIGLILIISIAVGVLYSLSRTDNVTITYDYEVSIFIGGRTVNNTTVYLEPPTTLLSNIQYIYAPLYLSNMEGEYTVTASSPENSGIIILKTSSAKADDTNAIELLTSISNKAIADHDKYYESIKTSLISTYESIGTSLNPADETKNPIDIALQLASLKKSSIPSKPRVTEIVSETTNKSPGFILTISIFGGLFFAIFAAFFAEFVSKVRERQIELNKDKI